MSKLLLILALGFGVLAPSATAQQHKVLVYSSQEDTRGEQLKNLLELLVDGEVEHRTNLPGLSEFEAVFYLNQFFQPVALSDQAVLAEFAHNGGALFLRGGFREGPIGEATNPLWHAVKDSGIMIASQSITTLGTYGLNGTFAACFEMGNPT